MEKGGILEGTVLSYIIVATLVGFIGRWWMLRGDIRQYPTYPNGYLIHLTTGFIAATMGAVAYPALIAKNYVAVTFLALATQQFREIRKFEKDSLEELEKTEYAPRGNAYIDGIAKTFEARNYIIMIASLVTTVVPFIIKDYLKSNLIVVTISAILGFTVIYLLKLYAKGHTMRDIVTIQEAPLEFKEGSNLYVGNIYVMNVGLTATKETILKNGIGLILKPKGESEKIIINHEGQRTAIIHECARILGLERYVATRRSFETDEVGLMIVPIKKDAEHLKRIIMNVPVLETNKKINPDKYPKGE